MTHRTLRPVSLDSDPVAPYTPEELTSPSFRQPDRGWQHCCWPRCRGPVPDALKPHAPFCSLHAHVAWNNIGVAIAAELDEHRGHMLGMRRAEVHAMTYDKRMERVARELADTPRDLRPGRIYYVRLDSHMKIGWAGDVRKRLRAYPPGISILAMHPGTLRDERAIHARFEFCRAHGREWYSRHPSLLDHIEAVRKEHGIPDPRIWLPRRASRWNGKPGTGLPATAARIVRG